MITTIAIAQSIKAFSFFNLYYLFSPIIKPSLKLKGLVELV
ncbi:hypothetical protein AALB_4238 [Agarivorans albus MKT 106]|uniref:Uncharacterized protein n=1 Tax=Agarivorans albus MKT 106 TaxID=1331007 RepID=R9PS97_AGAAL|nr:hypothetical protein AALB_4238 [Agarivorans albus MKT 106]